MRKFLLSLLVTILLFTGLGFAKSVEARTYVRGYTKKSGTYVLPHYRSDRNYSKFDNWSTKGNYNPYTGKKGYKNFWR